MVEAAPQARPEDHLGGIFCSSFVCEYHLSYQCSATLPAQWCFPFFGSSGFYRFGRDFGAAIWTFLVNFGTTIVFFGMRVCRSPFLKILGSECGCLGLQNQAFGVGGIAKTSFSHMLGLCRFWCHFYMVFDGFGTNLNDFWWLGGRLGTL